VKSQRENKERLAGEEQPGAVGVLRGYWGWGLGEKD